MKSLTDVAKAYKQAVLEAINPGVPYKGYKTGSSRAYDTGRLFNSINSANNIQGMTKLGRDRKSFTFSFNISPNGAPYGKFVHNGTYKMAKRPYGEIAAGSKTVKDAIDDYMNQVVENELEVEFEQLNEQFLRAGFKIS